MKFKEMKRAMVPLLVTAFVLSMGNTWAQKKYDTGVSDNEIRIGNLAPYSGPASAYGAIGKAIGAYFAKVNDEGGINGRKIQYISLDDAYTPGKSVEQTRKLVEQDEVFLVFAAVGTAQNVAVQKYLNGKKVPQLFLLSGTARWNDTKNFPWSMAWIPSLETEGRIYAQHILESHPKARIAVLSQNDEFGKDNVKGLMAGLGDHAKSMIVAQSTYELTDPSIDSQIVTLKSSGADVLISFATAKFAAQAIRKAVETGWKPVHYVSSVSNSVSAVMKPAGFQSATGVLSATYFRDPTDVRWKDSKELADYNGWMRKYNKEADASDALNVVGYSHAQTLVQVLKQAGDDLTRENVMKQARTLDMTLPMLLPGVNVKTSPTDSHPIERMQLIRFTGTTFEPVGPIYGR